MSYFNLLLSFCDITTIGLCIVLKGPQVLSLLKKNSVEGISLSGVLLEYLAHLIVFCYNYVQGYELMSYFEYAFLLIQDLIIILVFFHVKGELDVLRTGALGLSIAFFYGLTQGMYLQNILSYLIMTVMPIGAISKIFYLKEVWTTKNAENISALTWAIATYVCFARMITNSEKGDMPLLVHCTVSFVLCSSMLVLKMIILKKPSLNSENNEKTNLIKSKKSKGSSSSEEELEIKNKTNKTKIK